jgi:hypothetical protein
MEYAIRAGMQSIADDRRGLLFAGDAGGRSARFDQKDGRVLWEMNLGSAVTGYPVTFEAGGHQYVAVSTGFWLGDSFTPELIKGTQGTLFVFALPDAGIGRQGPYRAPVDGSRPTPGISTPLRAGLRLVRWSGRRRRGRCRPAGLHGELRGVPWRRSRRVGGIPPLRGPAS